MRKRDRIAVLVGCNRKGADDFVRRVNASLAERASISQMLRVLRMLPGEKRSHEHVIVALGGDPNSKGPAKTARQTHTDLASLQWGIGAERVPLATPQPSQENQCVSPSEEPRGLARSDRQAIGLARTPELTWDIQTAVVGVTFEGRQATVACLSRGEEVWLRREPGNGYDANAIRVERANGQQIGYVGRFLAANLAPAFDRSSQPVHAFVLAIVGGYYEASALGVRIGFNLPGEPLAYTDAPGEESDLRRMTD